MTDLSDFQSVERVIADPVRMKLKLGIGDEAFASLRVGNLLHKFWTVGGVAAGGIALAQTSTVASFFGASGFWGAIGLGTAATPIGWVVAAAIVSGGAYYGVMSLAKRYRGSRVEEIPKFINTPIDLLGASLLDLMGTLAVKLAEIDGSHDDDERQVIREYFLHEWGYDPEYLDRALSVIEENSGKQSLPEAVMVLIKFASANPDCDLTSLKKAILGMLREIAEADGRLDERELWALEQVQKAFADAQSSYLARAVGAVAAAPMRAVSWAANRVQTPQAPDPEKES